MSVVQTPIDYLCEVMHDAYEAAATDAGWETQARSRKPWADLPEPNKATMRAAVGALLHESADFLEAVVASEMGVLRGDFADGWRDASSQCVGELRHIAGPRP